MNFPKLNVKINFKSKRFWVVLGVIIIISVILMSSFGTKVSKYETAIVEKGDLVQTVDATGTLGSTNDLSLYFVSSGIVKDIRVNEGDEVRLGQWLGNLSLAQLSAAVDQAQSSLDQKLAGATLEQIVVSQKQVESAQISLDKATETLVDTISLADKNMKAQYAAAQNGLDDAYIKMYNAYSTVDAIKKTYFNGNDQESFIISYNHQYEIKAPMDASKILIDASKSSGKIDDVDSAISSTVTSLNRILNALTAIRSVCESTGGYSTRVTATDKTALDNQKSYISTSQTAVSLTQNNISILKTQNANDINADESAVNSAKANLDLQQANYNSLVAKPRDIDIAYYQAALNQAIAARNNAIIYAPINGVITKVNKKVGELINSSEAMFSLMSPEYQIEIDVPETDVVKIKANDEAIITFDALGNDTKFKGKILSIDPASTNIQDVVYYKVKVGIEDSMESLKPGMTADVLIKTNSRQDVVYVPSQAVLSKSSSTEKYVRVLKSDDIIEERTVSVGLKADDGKYEILSGINEGEIIVLRLSK